MKYYEYQQIQSIMISNFQIKSLSFFITHLLQFKINKFLKKKQAEIRFLKSFRQAIIRCQVDSYNQI